MSHLFNAFSDFVSAVGFVMRLGSVAIVFYSTSFAKRHIFFGWLLKEGVDESLSIVLFEATLGYSPGAAMGSGIRLQASQLVAF